jgi:EpsI family protein
MTPGRRKAAAFLAATLASAGASVAMVPRAGIAEMTGERSLEELFPRAFADWRIDPHVIPIAASAELRQRVAETYDQTLARTYADASGYRVMLSVAYGGRRNQGMDLHRPEICYPAQGLAIRRETRDDALRLPGASLPLKRLVAGSTYRNEPISYWLVIGSGVASFGYGHRLALLKYGLTGHVPDGMLVRVSSIDEDERGAFEHQDAFLRDLLAALAPDFRRHVTGQGA